MNNPFESIDEDLKFIEEEITIRVESLKIELDDMEKVFHQKIKNIREDLIKYINHNVF